MNTVSLEELNADAAMLTRVDRKYVLRSAELAEVLTRLEQDAPETRVLSIDGRTAHSYRSVYFDTPDLASFMMAARPRRRRFKLRTRTYLDTGAS
ncbi:MAG: VTC domain-containing protein, partial [Corynebacterium variabile]